MGIREQVVELDEEQGPAEGPIDWRLGGKVDLMHVPADAPIRGEVVEFSPSTVRVRVGGYLVAFDRTGRSKSFGAGGDWSMAVVTGPRKKPTRARERLVELEVEHFEGAHLDGALAQLEQLPDEGPVQCQPPEEADALLGPGSLLARRASWIMAKALKEPLRVEQEDDGEIDDSAAAGPSPWAPERFSSGPSPSLMKHVRQDMRVAASISPTGPSPFAVCFGPETGFRFVGDSEVEKRIAQELTRAVAGERVVVGVDPAVFGDENVFTIVHEDPRVPELEKELGRVRAEMAAVQADIAADLVAVERLLADGTPPPAVDIRAASLVVAARKIRAELEAATNRRDANAMLADGFAGSAARSIASLWDLRDGIGLFVAVSEGVRRGFGCAT